MMNKENIVWKTYPEINFLQANQFGEVRTVDHYTTCKDGRRQFIKGHVLKQFDNGRGYMRVFPYVNGKIVHLRVNRVVATCFLPNPDNLPEVNHKDNNPKNNSAENLEWCTREYNITYREKYGKACNRPVFAVNLKTFEVLYFESQHEAARQLGLDRGNIKNILEGRQNQAGGYWFTEDESEITEEKVQEIKDRMISRDGVVAVNLKTLEVLYFESQKEAAQQLGVSSGNVNNVLKGRRKQTHGFWFCYADSNAIENTRAKFGDEVAGKVQALLDEKIEN